MATLPTEEVTKMNRFPAFWGLVPHPKVLTYPAAIMWFLLARRDGESGFLYGWDPPQRCWVGVPGVVGPSRGLS